MNLKSLVELQTLYDGLVILHFEHSSTQESTLLEACRCAYLWESPCETRWDSYATKHHYIGPLFSYVHITYYFMAHSFIKHWSLLFGGPLLISFVVALLNGMARGYSKVFLVFLLLSFYFKHPLCFDSYWRLSSNEGFWEVILSFCHFCHFFPLAFSFAISNIPV